MARLRGWGIVAMGLTAVLTQTTFSGQLKGFEDAVSKPHASSSSSYDSDDDDSGNLAVGIVVSFVRGTYEGVKYLAYGWWAAPSEESSQYGESLAEDTAAGNSEYIEGELDGQNGLVHKPGSLGLPYVRFDYRWQYLDSEIFANDFLLETGYKYFAFSGRVTKYEGGAGEHLEIEQYYGMLRYGGSDDFFFPGAFQIGLGLGEYSIKGQQKQDGAALTIPITFCPYDWVGFEIRPAWARINDRTIGDYDFSVSGGYRFMQLRAGYRWLWVQGEGHWLNGPYAGLSVMF